MRYKLVFTLNFVPDQEQNLREVLKDKGESSHDTMLAYIIVDAENEEKAQIKGKEKTLRKYEDFTGGHWEAKTKLIEVFN